MKIELLKMKLVNFMYYEENEFSFPMIAKIMAKNGRGKSSIATAYTWCLFDCDYDLKSNPKVRREVNGKPIDDKDVAVELEIKLNDKPIKLKKVQKRKYSKDGESYKDDNQYFVNDVKKTKKDLEAYLDVDMTAFKMCSNINAFLNQKPAEMREYLFQTVKDNASDFEIASETDGLQDLVELLEHYTSEEIKAMSNAKIKEVDEKLHILDGQIKETEFNISKKQTENVSDLELLKKDLQDKLDTNIKIQTNNDKLIAGFDEAVSDVMDLEFKLSDMAREANESFHTKKNNLHSEKQDLLAKIEECKREANRLASDLAIENKLISDNENKRKEQATLWKIANEREFDETSLVCQYCGQEYQEDKKEQLRAEFEAHKADELKRITGKGTLLQKTIQDSKILAESLKDNLKKSEDKLKKLNEKFSEKEKEEQNLVPLDVKNTAEYKEIEAKIILKEETMKKNQSLKDVTYELKMAENDIRQQLADVEKKISGSNTEEDEKRLDELKNTRQQLEQDKAFAEKNNDLLKELEKAKNDEFLESVNANFGIVKWQLFELAKNGNYKSICVPTIDGKSILTTMSNKGNRILGRVDICKSVQEISDIKCPIWLDDLESLDKENQSKVANMVDSQLILLEVSENSELEIKEVK